MPEQFFYRARALYEVGDIVHSGNWGRVLFGVGASHGFFLREYALEQIRLSSYPNKPSRLSSTFAYVSEAAAQAAFQDHLLYRVELADPTLPAHRGDVDWVDLIPQLHSFDAVTTAAHHYWSGTERVPRSSRLCRLEA